MRRQLHFLAAAGLLAPACSPAPAPPRPDAGPSTTGPANLSADAASTPASAGPTTTLLVTVPTDPPTTTRVLRPLPTTTLPEAADEGLTDAEWWATQPGFAPGACGGSLPPCWVMRAESGGDIHAVNPATGAAGKWQFVPSTSRAMGYSRPMDQYDESTQDEAARALWAGGRGCSHWDAC